MIKALCRTCTPFMITACAVRNMATRVGSQRVHSPPGLLRAEGSETAQACMPRGSWLAARHDLELVIRSKPQHSHGSAPVDTAAWR